MRHGVPRLIIEYDFIVKFRGVGPKKIEGYVP